MKYQEELNKLENGPGFFHHNNYHILDIDEKHITLKADLTKDAMNPYGFAHGGFIFGLGDTVMGMIAYTSGKTAVTLDANITYLHKGRGKYLIAKGELIKSGKSTSFVKADIYNDQEQLVATMTSNYFYID